MDVHQPLSILLVEDDKHASEILHSMLSMRCPDARIYCAGDGIAGLDCIRRHRPDIVITDINMPEVDGFGILAGIPAIKPDIRVIVITAHSDRQNLEKIASTGVDVEIVHKPLDFTKLFASITRCIESLSSK
jgi:two-component system chemotaxis response regulator CheY